MKYVPRNEYFELIGKLGVKKVESEYEIADLDLSSYSLNEDTKRIANVNFMEETKDRNGNYMLGGHWMSDLSYQFTKKCKFDLVQVDASYCGENDQWMFPAIALRDTTINKNDRICQFEIQKIQPEIEFEEVEHLDEVSRGGIGSTGKA